MCCGGKGSCGCSDKKDGACGCGSHEKKHDHHDHAHEGGCCGGGHAEIELSAEQISMLNRLIEDNSDEDLTDEEIEQIRSILFAQQA